MKKVLIKMRSYNRREFGNLIAKFYEGHGSANLTFYDDIGKPFYLIHIDNVKDCKYLNFLRREGGRHAPPTLQGLKSLINEVEKGVSK